jgi:hypothetical protein
LYIYILYKHIFHVCSMCMWNVCTCMYILSSFVQDTDIHYTWDSMFAKCSYKKKWRIQRGKVSSCVWSSYSLQPLFLHVNMFLYIYILAIVARRWRWNVVEKHVSFGDPPWGW